jgi:hypothetical protein
MAVPTTMADLSTTASSNSPAGGENPISTDDFHRAIQSILRHQEFKGADIASATTTNIGAATGGFIDVTGTTTITGLGTISAGIVRRVRFTGSLTLTHNATSLILPTSANIQTRANDVALFISLGSGNWTCLFYQRKDGTQLFNKGVSVAAHATTSDIWSGGDYVTLTGGVVTFTDVADAPVADRWVWVKSNAAHVLTDGANIAVQGSANYTLAAGDLMLWHAITTTTFEVYIFPDAGFTVADASTTVKGKVELTTTAEMAARTDTTRAVTAESLQGIITSGTVIATTSGTSHDFTGIPSWAKRITVMVAGVSISGSSDLLMQIGDAGGIENTGYVSSCGSQTGSMATSTSGFRFTNNVSAAAIVSGHVVLTLLDASTNTWVESGVTKGATTTMGYSGGDKALSATLTQIRLTTVNGTDTFDAGSVNILYE